MNRCGPTTKGNAVLLASAGFAIAVAVCATKLNEAARAPGAEDVEELAELEASGGGDPTFCFLHGGSTSADGVAPRCL